MNRRKLSKTASDAMHKFVESVETLLHLDAEQVGHIADHIGEYGTDGDGGDNEDAVVRECLCVIIDNHGRE